MATMCKITSIGRASVVTAAKKSFNMISSQSQSFQQQTEEKKNRTR